MSAFLGQWDTSNVKAQEAAFNAHNNMMNNMNENMRSALQRGAILQAKAAEIAATNPEEANTLKIMAAGHMRPYLSYDQWGNQSYTANPYGVPNQQGMNPTFANKYLVGAALNKMQQEGISGNNTDIIGRIRTTKANLGKWKDYIDNAQSQLATIPNNPENEFYRNGLKDKIDWANQYFINNKGLNDYYTTIINNMAARGLGVQKMAEYARGEKPYPIYPVGNLPLPNVVNQTVPKLKYNYITNSWENIDS